MSSLPRTRLTRQGQVSVPAEVRRRMGLAAGSVLEWEVDGDRVVVRRAGKISSEDLHDALFPEPPEPRTTEEMDEGVREHVKRRHARG